VGSRGGLDPMPTLLLRLHPRCWDSLWFVGRVVVEGHQQASCWIARDVIATGDCFGSGSVVMSVERRLVVVAGSARPVGSCHTVKPGARALRRSFAGLLGRRILCCLYVPFQAEAVFRRPCLRLVSVNQGPRCGVD
jgi:hypothetical protein